MRRIAVLALAFACGLLGAVPAAGQVSVGGQVSLTGDAEPGVGPRFGIPLGRLAPRLSAAVSFDWFFAEQDNRARGLGADVTYYELNGSVLYAFGRDAAAAVRPYAGAGLNVAHESLEYDGGTAAGSTSGTELGLNLLAGTRFRSARTTPFAEIRLELGGGEHIVLSAGLLFGGAREAGVSR